ncbi:MAG: hypothetical protein B7Y40_10385 [Gammaproteobacteria bacterium 28-57-27]|nr:MAG: hypothetical protein B7Y40_10385 [Gammaproteobacteria bacterium 28-57-27]
MTRFCASLADATTLSGKGKNSPIVASLRTRHTLGTQLCQAQQVWPTSLSVLGYFYLLGHTYGA